MHPLLLQDDLVDFCNKQKIHITSYSPLGNNGAHPPFATSLVHETGSYFTLSIVVGLPKLTEHHVVQEVATKHGSNTTTAQVLIAWGAYRGFSIIPKSVNEGEFLIFPSVFMILFRCFWMPFFVCPL
jgi:L-glyceraldehyde reductase